MILPKIILLLVSYLTGSIATSVWWGKAFYGKDVRNFGSGNAGATNTFRVLGKKAGIVVLIVDVLKGVVATMYPLLYMNITGQTLADPTLWQILCGVAAVLGHIFPIYEKFKGGKGVATVLGVALGLQPMVSLICVAIFLVILISTKYVSLGSMLASVAFPLLLLVPAFSPDSRAMYVFGAVMCIAVIFTHKKNINRLRAGNENKTYLFGKKNKAVSQKKLL